MSQPHIIQATPEAAAVILRWQQWVDRFADDGADPDEDECDEAAQHLAKMLQMLLDAVVLPIGGCEGEA